MPSPHWVYPTQRRWRLTWFQKDNIIFNRYEKCSKEKIECWICMQDWWQGKSWISFITWSRTTAEALWMWLVGYWTGCEITPGHGNRIRAAKGVEAGKASFPICRHHIPGMLFFFIISIPSIPTDIPYFGFVIFWPVKPLTTAVTKSLILSF